MRIVIYTLGGGVAGFFLGATAASIIAAILRTSKMEGGVGALAAGIGILTGLLGMIVTLLGVLYSRGASVTGLLRGTLGTIAVLGVTMFVIYWFQTHSQAYFTRKHGSVAVEFEFAPAAGEHLPSELPAIELREGDHHDEATFDAPPRPQASRPSVLSGKTRLFWLTRDRELIVHSPDMPDRKFPLIIPRDPSTARVDWSPWTQPATGANWKVRYRVIK
jgi:hypothetical protein